MFIIILDDDKVYFVFLLVLVLYIYYYYSYYWQNLDVEREKK